MILLFLAFQIQISSQTSEEIENKNLVLIVKNDGGEFISAFTLSMITYEYFVRYTFIGALLNKKRLRN
jgi:hypothetical protein